MGRYKDIEIPDELEGLIHHMAEVEGYRDELTILGQRWDLLTILGQMSGGSTDMTSTREGFKDLTAQLLSHLGIETLKKSVQQITAKAQVAVDIVIRNLFERTADIGFLATDDDIREFLRTQGDPSVLVSRFQEYVAKYSVYHNIILLDTAGNVLAQIDRSNAVEHSADPLIREALETSQAYVEVFRHSDLEPGADTSLIYAFRVTETNDSGSSPLGVLCLCFRFQNEMEGVFGNLTDENDWSVVLLLDKEGRVIASSDTCHVPLGARMDLAIDQPYKVVKFAGRSYLAKTCPTKGYQGFMGLGWYGHVMLPLEHAFNTGESKGNITLEHELLEAVMRNPRLFSPELRDIPKHAEQIQRELDRTVWNGNVRQDSDGRQGDNSANKVLLWEISKTGAQTKNVFERSIGNLHETVVSSILADVENQASLAIDIMDRNLYERANDCRWWALTSAFRQILAKGTVSDQDACRISDILRYINGLYTVYSNLLVYDRNNTVIAVSNPAEQRIVGRKLGEQWVRQSLTISDSQRYAVSPFEATYLYNEKPTYIYAAAITDRAHRDSVLGGIGIVFDGEPQFKAMLIDSLPRDGSGELLSGCIGLFCDRQCRVISSTEADIPVNEPIDLDESFFGLRNGERVSKIVEFRGKYFAVGASTSCGYREYKGLADDYKNDVVALIMVPLGDVCAVEERSAVPKAADMSARNARRVVGRDAVEIATFYVGGHWFGFKAEDVVEAVNVEKITKLPHRSAALLGLKVFRDKALPVLSLHGELCSGQYEAGSDSQIVVAKTRNGLVGFVVDSLGEIPQVTEDRIDRQGSLVKELGHYIDSLVKPDPDEEVAQLLVVLEPTRLVQQLLGSAEGANLLTHLKDYQEALGSPAAAGERSAKNTAKVERHKSGRDATAIMEIGHELLNQ